MKRWVYIRFDGGEALFLFSPPQGRTLFKRIDASDFFFKKKNKIVFYKEYDVWLADWQILKLKPASPRRVNNWKKKYIIENLL